MLAPLLLLLLASDAAAAQQATAEAALQNIRPIFNRGNFAEAEPKINAALAAFGKHDSEAVWTLRIMQGWLYARTDRLKLGRQILDVEPPAKYAKSEMAFRRLTYLAFLDRETKDLAERWATQAIALAAKHHPQLLPDANFAAASYGDPKLRQQRLRETLRLAVKQKNPIEARARVQLGYWLSGQERYADAVQEGEAALAHVRAAGSDDLLVQAVGNLAWSYQQLGDDDRAAELFTEGVSAAARTGNSFEQVRWLIQLGHLRRNVQDFEGAARYYSQALAAASAEHPSRGQILRAFANLALEGGRLDEARRHLAAARAHKPVSKDTEADPHLRADLLEARIHLAAGRRDAAEKILRRIGAEAAAKDVEWDAKTRLAVLHGETKRDAEAERLFRELIGSGFEVRRALKIDLQLAFSNVMNETFDAFADFLVARKRVEEALNVTESGRARTMEEALKRPPSPRPLDARAIARERKATIFSYWLGRHRSLVWVVTPDKPMTVYPLPRQIDIEREVDAYHRDLMGARGSLEMIAARGQKLYEMLIGNVAPAIASGSRVIVVPDGRLHVLNFETLIVPKPQRHYWIEDAIVITASSLELVGRSNGAPRAPRSLLLIGDPPKEDPQFPPLAHAAAEIDLVTQHFPQRSVLRKKNATPASYRNAAPERYDVLHFVAHGVANRLKPLESAVILGNDGSGYKLYAYEIVAKPLSAQLVTISSCHGAGTRTYGEGLVGLAWAFLGAGAENVIAALWEVDDRATPRLMDSLYEGIRAGHDPAVALREAKLKMVRSKSVYDRARYWAPFVLYSGS